MIQRLIPALFAILAFIAPLSVDAAMAQNTAPLASNAPLTTAGTPTTQPGQRESYMLGRGDVVEVSVLGRSDYVARVQIQDDGTILLPYINAVPAANRSVLALREQIRGALKAGGFFADPAVNVSVVSYGSRYVTVLGQVTTPGVVPIDRAYRVSEIIARAGGVPNAAIDVITLTRSTGESSDLSLREIATGGADKDPLVSDGDKIFVAAPKTFYIYGQVNAPGNYPVDQTMTIRMALARGGGLTALGSEKRVKLIRGERELPKPRLTDAILPGDVVVVGERFF
jgi:polysaccharide export outer membrane protein